MERKIGIRFPVPHGNKVVAPMTKTKMQLDSRLETARKMRNNTAFSIVMPCAGRIIVRSQYNPEQEWDFAILFFVDLPQRVVA